MKTESLTGHDSPYVGPRPFERRHTRLFYGRTRESADLLSLVTANQIVLVYAQSGVGKTSLLNAGLIPLLEKEEFEILPITRVRGLIPDTIPYSSVANPYVFNTLISWSDESADPTQLIGASLDEYLRSRPHLNDDIGFELPRVAIFDQFEELFSFYPDRWEQRQVFFDQMRKTLEEDDLFRVILVMREDFIAQLDAYASVVPGQFRTRFRLNPMTPETALSAVVDPLKTTTRSYAEGVAEQIIAELTKVRVETRDGKTTVVAGEFVEPVQLQVVCQNLWEHLPPDVHVIERQHVEAFGDIDQALAQFYEDCLTLAIQKTGISEETLRNWFNTVLITPAETRGTVYQDTDDTGGIPNETIAILESEHIIRPEIRAGGRWYELTHDRFIGPIRESNEEWGLCIEQEKQLAKERALRQRTRRQLSFIALLVVILIGAVALSLYALDQRSNAQHSAQDAQTQAAIAENNAATATVAQGQALNEADNAATQAAIAENNAATATVAQGQALNEADNAATQAANAENNAATATMAQGQALNEAANAATQAANAENSAATATVAQGQALNEADNAATQAANAHAAQATAERNSDVARSIAQASGAKDLLAHDQPEWAIALALEANQLTEPPPIAYLALFDAVTQSRVRARLHSHLQAVTAIEYSPNGDFFYSASSDQTIIAWDAQSGNEIRRFEGHDTSIWEMAVSPDGEYIVSGSDDGEVIVWRVRDGSIVHRIEAFDYAIRGIDVNSVGTEFLASDGLSIRFWNIETGEEVPHPTTFKGFLTDVMYGYNDSRLIFSSIISVTRIDGSQEEIYTLIDYDLRPNQDHHEYQHDAPIWSIAISPDGQFAATGAEDGTIKIWDLFNRTEKQSFREFSYQVYDLAFSPDQRYLLTSSWGNPPLIWNIDTGNIVRVLSGETAGAISVDYAPDGYTAISGSDDSSIIIWDVQTDDILSTIDRHEAAVSVTSFSPTQPLFATGDYRGTIHLWDANTYDHVREFVGHNSYDAISALDFNNDSSRLLSSAGETLYLWDVATGAIVASFSTDEGNNILGADLSHDEKYIAAGYGSGKIIIWELETRQIFTELEGHSDAVFAVKFSPDDNTLLSGGGDFSVRLWDWRTGEPIYVFNEHYARVNAVDFSPDGSTAVSGGGDDTIIMWDLKTGTPIDRLRGHADFINDVVYSRDGQYLLSGSDDDTLILWDAHTKEPLLRFEGHEDWVLGVALSPDNTKALSGSWDESVIVWNVEPHPEGLFLWQQANRAVAELTCDQREIYQTVLQCDENNQVPTRTPFPTLVPTATFTPSPTIDWTQVTATPSPTNTGTPSPQPQVVLALEQANVAPASGYQFTSRDEVTVDLSGEDDLIRWELVGGIYDNFAIGSTITWGPGAAEDRCGFVFRKSDDSRSFYILRIDQLNNVSFTPYVDGTYDDTEYATTETTVSGEGNQNTLVLFAIGNQFTVYVNDQLVAQFTNDAFDSGQLGWVAGTYDQSDETFCTFTDTWVWDFEFDAPVIASPTPTPTVTPTATATPRAGVQDVLEGIGVPLASGYEAEQLVESRRIEVTDKDNWIETAFFSGIYSNFVVGADFTWGPGATEDYCGFYARYDAGNRYKVHIDRNGIVEFRERTETGWQELRQVSSSAINVQADATNELVVIVLGDTFSVYVNGVYAAQYRDDSLTSGSVGLIAGTYDESDETWCDVSDAWVWEITTENTMPPASPTPTVTIMPTVTPSPQPQVVSILEQAGIAPSSGYQRSYPDEIKLDLTDRDNWVDWEYINDSTYDNFAIGSTITWGPGAAEDRCGFIFRKSESGAYYLLRIDQLNYITLSPYIDGAYSDTEYAKTDAIVTGEGNENTLVLFALGDQFTVYVNGYPAAQFTSDLVAAGQLGWIAGTYDESEETFCTFKDTWVWDFEFDTPVVVPATPSLPPQVAAMLEQAGIAPSSGYQQTYPDQVKLDLSGEGSSLDFERIGDETYDNFAVGSTVTWGPGDSRDECGFYFRHASGSDYILKINRRNEIIFETRVDREFVDAQEIDTAAIILGTGEQNDLVLFAVDNQFTVYINGQLIAQFTDDTHTDGQLGWLAGTHEQSDTSYCLFTDTWVLDFENDTPVIASPTPIPTVTPMTMDMAPAYVQTPLAISGLPLTGGHVANLIASERIDLSDDDNILSLGETFDGTYTDTVVGTSFAWGPGATEDGCGIEFRRVDGDNHYSILIDQQGRIRFIAFVDNEPQSELVDGDMTIATGEGAENDLEVMIFGDTFNVYVNGTYVAQFIDGSHSQGEIGLAALTLDESDQTWCDFSNAWVWEITG